MKDEARRPVVSTATDIGLPWWAFSWWVSGWPQVCSWCSWPCWRTPTCSMFPAETDVVTMTKKINSAQMIFSRVKKKQGHTSTLLEEGDTVAMMDVLVRPPSESCRIRVSLDSLWDRYNYTQFQSFLVPWFTWQALVNEIVIWLCVAQIQTS